MLDFFLTWTAAEVLAFAAGCAGLVILWACFSWTEDVPDDVDLGGN